ncbi:MAG: Hsp20/alpha crystallin family protein [Deltaproteobacteria bacterium]|nr:Hsp20/alpha crystallin family protein [Deltaproteobacteria bacterium]
MNAPRNVHPSFDLLEGPRDLVVLFDLPGVKEESVSLRFEAGQLVLDASQSTEPAEASWLRPARYRATLELPDSLDPGAIEASLDDGVLEVRIAKAARAQPRTIAIKSAN